MAKMIEPKHGHIILYSYLWAREHDQGEESGRKARPSYAGLTIQAYWKFRGFRQLARQVSGFGLNPGPAYRCVEG
jgi:hypothetical protein